MEHGRRREEYSLLCELDGFEKITAEAWMRARVTVYHLLIVF